MSQSSLDLLKKINDAEGVTDVEMSHLMWPLINVAKAASSLVLIVSKLSEDALNQRDQNELAALVVLTHAINQLAKTEPAATLDA